MKFTIKSKLYLSFGSILVFLIIVGLFSLIALNDVNQKSTEIASSNIPRIHLAHAINTLQSDFRLNENQYLRATTKEEKQKKEHEMKQKVEELEDLYEEMSKYIPKDREKLWQAQLDSWDQYLELEQKVMTLFHQNKMNEAMQLFTGDSIELFNELSEANLNSVIQAINEANTASAEGDEIYAKSFRVEVILIIATILLSMIITQLLCRNIDRSFKNLISITKQVASGDLSQTIVIKSKDEFAELGKAINDMINHLKALVVNIQDISYQVAASSEELTASAEQTSLVTNDIALSVNEIANDSIKQLEQVDETTVIVSQMSANIAQVGVRATTSSESGCQAVQTAVSGIEAVEKTLMQMDYIEETIEKVAVAVEGLGNRSNEIGQIVEVISDISAQTNLLALNAAIEAARAGDYGKGFAVVADEVRKLAEQSQKAAEEISLLINTIQVDTEKAVQLMGNGKIEVTKGTETVKVSGEAIRTIVELVKEMSIHFTEIDNEIKQIAAGTGQIVSSSNEVNNTFKNVSGESQTISAATEEQSASMEQIAASSRSLAEMAQTLEEEIRKFKL